MSGIYLHIPFCRQACTYCDFHFSTSLKSLDEMFDAIRRELIIQKNYTDEKIETIYFGGGTPSLAGTELLKSLLTIIQNEFNVASDAEITLEANPDDLNEKKSAELRAIGINRLSIGIQSFSDEELRMMNRAHDSLQALSVVKNARAAGFENISIDLIYGIPESTAHQWEENVDTALGLNVEHLSCYALTVEPRTVLADMIRKKKINKPDDEKAVADLELLISKTSKAGYKHYEISNFARDKKYSRHNTSYWKRKNYLGVGPSAHSFNGESRQWNISNNMEYIRALKEGKLLFEREELSESNKFNEYILTSLRTMWGIDLEILEMEFKNKFSAEFKNNIQSYIRSGMLVQKGKTISLTHAGKFFADRIASELFN